MSTRFFIEKRGGELLGFSALNGNASILPINKRIFTGDKQYFAGDPGDRPNEDPLEFHDKITRFCLSPDDISNSQPGSVGYGQTRLAELEEKLSPGVLIVDVYGKEWTWKEFKRKISGPDAEMSLSDLGYGSVLGRTEES